MEHTEQDIRNINFGYAQLDEYLKDEARFIQRLNESEPYRYCFDAVYKTLVGLGELPLFFKNENSEIILEAKEQASQWAPNSSEVKINYISKAVLVISNLAEKRLAKTTGV